MKVLPDLEVLIGGERKFDLFVVGLQEVPRTNMARLLQKVLVDTHRLENILLCIFLVVHLIPTRGNILNSFCPNRFLINYL